MTQNFFFFFCLNGYGFYLEGQDYFVRNGTPIIFHNNFTTNPKWQVVTNE